MGVEIQLQEATREITFTRDLLERMSEAHLERCKKPLQSDETLESCRDPIERCKEAIAKAEHLRKEGVKERIPYFRELDKANVWQEAVDRTARRLLRVPNERDEGDIQEIKKEEGAAAAKLQVIYDNNNWGYAVNTINNALRNGEAKAIVPKDFVLPEQQPGTVTSIADHRRRAVRPSQDGSTSALILGVDYAELG